MSDRTEPMSANSASEHDWIRCTESAAFRSGRFFNQIEHLTTALWLRGTEFEVATTTGAIHYSCERIPWNDLRLASRGAISDEQRRVVCEGIISSSQGDWARHFLSLWHVQLLRDQNEMIETDRQSSFLAENGPSLRVIIARRWEFALGTVVEILRNLNAAFIDSLDSRALEYFRFGKFVDGLTFPVPAFAELADARGEHRSDHPMRMELPSADRRTPRSNPWGGTDVTAADQRSTGAVLSEGAPRRFLTQPLGFCPPTPHWWDEFLQRGLLCGIQGHVLQQIRANVVHHQGDSHWIAVQTGIAIDSRLVVPPEIPLDVAPEIPAADASNEGSGWERTPLGIEINVNERAIRREGSEAATDLRPTALRVLRFMARKGSVFTSKSELESHWTEFSGRSAPDSRSGVSKQITQVRVAISGLGFDIDPEGQGSNLAWRIISR